MSDKPHGPSDNPLSQLWVAMSGASSGHHEDPPGLDEKSVAVGHEPDRFGIGGIVAVPIAVVVSLVITYLTVTMIFRYVNANSSDPIASRDATINSRLGRIGSDGGTTAPDAKHEPVGEPRLDGLPKIDTRVGGKDVAPYLMSFEKTPAGNWPDIYPEDLRAGNYIDYATRTRPLKDEAGYLDKERGVARLPIQKAIDLLVKGDALSKQYVPVSDKPVARSGTVADKAKMSNGGQKLGDQKK